MNINIQTVTSAGGIEAWLIEEHAVPILALHFAFDGGSAQNPAGKEGLANFIAHMLDEGAGDLPGLAFQERLKDLGIHLRFQAERDDFSATLEVLVESLDEAVRLLRPVLTEPHFRADAMERIRQRINVGIAQAQREPVRVAAALWDEVAFAGHPYAQPGIGTTPSVGAIAADDLQVYCRRVFGRDTLKVVAVGAITPDDLSKVLDQLFGGLPPKASLNQLPHLHRIPAGRQAIVEMDVPQSAVAFGMAAIAQHDPDYVAAIVLNSIVGGGSFSSRLMEEVRVKRGLAYSVSSVLAPSRYASVWRGGVATRNDMVGHTLDVIRAELSKVAAGEISETALDNAKSYLIGSYPLRFDANGKIAAQLLGLRVDGFGSDYVGKRNAMVAAVTLDDLKRVAKRVFTPENLIVTVCGKPSLQAAPDRNTSIETSAA